VLVLVAAVAAGLLLVSGGAGNDPRTPRGLPGLPPPFLGTAVVGRGGLTAAIDTYGDVVDLRAPGPAGGPLIDNPSDRQAAGTVPADVGIVPLVRVGRGPALPLWRADSVHQSYENETNAVVTVAELQGRRVVVKEAAQDGALALTVRVRSRGKAAVPAATVDLDGGSCLPVRGEDELTLTCTAASTPLPWGAERLIRAAAHSDRRWLGAARPLGAGAPAWAKRMYERSLLVLRALTDRRAGAVAAGARDGWAYVWPRDAAAVALALDAAGYRNEARRVTRFLLGLDLDAAARFDGDGDPVPGRGPQGDASGWVAAAARTVGLEPPPPTGWRDLPDYQEGAPGNYLGNALSSHAEGTHRADGPKRQISTTDGTKRGLYRAKSSRRLVRRVGDPNSGLDSAAAWAVRPFSQPDLYPAARATLRRLVARGTDFGITPGEAWPGRDPWTAPTAWSAWSFGALARGEGNERQAHADRRAALHLLADLQRAATPAGALPERVDARTGVPRSTTPLAWSHAFAILALREFWPR
jgi:glycosyl hydrolase family 15